jgi:integrase/recombinase XerD
MRNGMIGRVERVETRFAGTTFRDYLDAFKLECQMKNLTEKSIDAYFERLGYFFDYLKTNELGLNQVTKRTIQDYVISLKDKVSDETINGRIRSYRRFFNFLFQEGLLESTNPMNGISLLRAAKRIKPIIEANDVQKISNSFDLKTFEGNRNRLMFLMFWDGMFRLSELLGLKKCDIDLNGHMVKVFGKGRKERMVPLGIKTLRLLHQYLIKWRTKYPGEYLICMRDGEMLSERRCHKIIQDIGKKAHLRLYPHLLRHSAATMYIRLGGNPAVLQKILGHHSISVTTQYLHLSNSDMVGSYETLSPSNCLKI